MDIKIQEHMGEYGPISPTIKPFKIIGFDSEDDSKGHPISFAFHDGENSFYTRHFDEALDFIYNQREATAFVAHNLEYDLGNLMKGCDFKYINEMIYSARLLSANLFGTKHIFLNSASFFQGSLKSLGKLVGIEKLDGDPFDEAYVIRDALIPQVFMSGLQARLNKMGVNLGVSIGQLAMAVFRRNFMPGPIQTFNAPEVLTAYYGGRVEVYYKGVVHGPLHVADINSSYPDVMKNNMYPDTARLEKSMLATHEYGFGKFTVHVPKACFVPPLPFRSPVGRLFFPVGDVTGSWTYAEVRKAVSMGCRVVREEAGIGTNFSVAPYHDFIEYFYTQRQAMKIRKEKDPGDLEAVFEDLFLKLIMNNRYGKDAQHRPSTMMTRFRLSEQKIAGLGKNVIENKIGPFFGYTSERKTPPKTANFLWGVYTTAYARLSLLNKMLAVHAAGSTLLYCDTDSIMFTGDAGLKALDVGTSLGQMGVETYDLGIFRQAKGYLLCDKQPDGDYTVEKVACKGVPTQYALDFIREGMVRALKPMRLKEALVRTHAKANKDKDAAFFRDIGVNVWREVPKVMQGVYIKRSGKSGVTYPVDVAIIPGLEESLGAAVNEEGLEEMRGLPIKPQERPGQAFRNVVIPAGWRRERKRAALLAETFFSAQKVQFLKREQLIGLVAGDTWFSGKVENLQKGKFGRYYVVRLKTFLGKNVARKKILGAFSETAFGFSNESFLGKSIEIILTQDYILGSAANLTVRFAK